MPERFAIDLLSRHAIREARRERTSVEVIALACEDPDNTRPSAHDELREIRTRWTGDDGIEIVVDTHDGRVVTVWRKGSRQ